VHACAPSQATAVVIAHEELASADPAFTLAYLAHSMLFVNNLAFNGNPEQCARLLPDVCSGAKIGGMGMSEPSCGTDVLAMRTHAVARPDGSYLLNGSKMWITNGAISDTETGDVYLVYARTAAGCVPMLPPPPHTHTHPAPLRLSGHALTAARAAFQCVVRKLLCALSALLPGHLLGWGWGWGWGWCGSNPPGRGLASTHCCWWRRVCRASVWASESRTSAACEPATPLSWCLRTFMYAACAVARKMAGVGAPPPIPQLHNTGVRTLSCVVMTISPCRHPPSAPPALPIADGTHVFAGAKGQCGWQARGRCAAHDAEP
jgi:hypothetical protein